MTHLQRTLIVLSILVTTPIGQTLAALADIVIRPDDAVADLFLRRKEIPRYKQSSQAARGGHSQQLRPLW